MMQKIPKGKLLVIGGGQDLSSSKKNAIIGNEGVLKRFEILMELIPKKKNHGKKYIEIITSASSEPNEVTKIYLKAFKKIGFSEVGFIFVGSNLESHDPKFIKRIKKAHAVLFSGGDQFRLTTVLGGTDVLDAVRQRYMEDPHFILAGSSAGAMALPALMILGGEINEAILNIMLKISSGFGFIDQCIIDTHFMQRGRFGRLSQAVVMNAGYLGIGIGEETALLITKGNHAECIGSGVVIIIDGKDIGHTNIAYADEDEALCIENLRVHILSNGNGFLLNERKFITSKKDLKRLLTIQNKGKGKKKTKEKNSKE
ncbi:MAG: cyanophycinase [Bacteroidota bacterium]